MDSLHAVLTRVATRCSDKDMDTFKHLIDAFGTAHLADLLQVEESHVRTMKARDSIPPEYWGVVLEHLPEQFRGTVSFADLRDLRARRFRSESAAA
jgi:hypothetical protein